MILSTKSTILEEATIESVIINNFSSENVLNDLKEGSNASISEFLLYHLIY